MDLAPPIASWIAAAALFAGFAGLGAYGLVLRRGALRARDALGPRRAQDAGALAAVGLVLALGTQILFVPFYVRSAAGHTVRAAFVKVTSEGGRSRTYTLHAVYKDASGRTQPVQVRVSKATYLRYYDMSFDCQLADVQAVVDREFAKVGQPNPPKVGQPGKRCEPIDLVVVDGLPSVAQLGTEPTADGLSVVVAAGLWGVLLFGVLREARRLSATGAGRAATLR
jgi:hypothetical protein